MSCPINARHTNDGVILRTWAGPYGAAATCLGPYAFIARTILTFVPRFLLNISIKRSIIVLLIEYVLFIQWLPTPIYTPGILYCAAASNTFNPPCKFDRAAG